VRQGFKWWEVDPTFYVLRVLSFVGILWDLKLPPKAVVRNEHRLGSRIVSRAATQLAASFRAECLAVAIGASLDGATLATLREQMIATQQRAANVLTNLHPQHIPTRNEICGRAMVMFVKTSSMDDIVDMAHVLILDAIGARLLPPQNRIMSRS
jgi:stearoyl-CoA desaturase (delta-9 desaturase)